MKNILYVDYVIKHIYVGTKAIWKAGNQVLVNFLASGSGSEIPFQKQKSGCGFVRPRTFYSTPLRLEAELSASWHHW